MLFLYNLHGQAQSQSWIHSVIRVDGKMFDKNPLLPRGINTRLNLSNRSRLQVIRTDHRCCASSGRHNPFDNELSGPFIADFACIEHRLVIEADGGQHAESKTDDRRTAWLERHGWRVLRFWNPDILRNTEEGQEMILAVLQNRL